MRCMVVIVPELTGYATIRHIAVSLPYASQLIDHVKYIEPQDVKPPEGDSERRRQRAPRRRCDRLPSPRRVHRWRGCKVSPLCGVHIDLDQISL